MSPHTPGPWCYSLDGEVFVDDDLPGRSVIAEVDTLQEAAEANARLIAAAPDLLDACKFLISILGVNRAVGAESPVDRIRTAIEKADGTKYVRQEGKLVMPDSDFVVAKAEGETR